MRQTIEVTLTPDLIHDREALRRAAAESLFIPIEEITAVLARRRSLDARGRQMLYRVTTEIYLGESPELPPPITWKQVGMDRPVIIVGGGPAGLFAALRLLEAGVKPVILERGKEHRKRRRDIKAIHQQSLVDPDSNYGFGEGGAGTFSDGKLYTRATKRGDVDKVLRILIQHGADPDIAVEAHPHIGSNHLYRIVEAMRHTILNAGGEIHFETRVDGLHLERGQARGVAAGGKMFEGNALILAAGHSARDLFHLLHQNAVALEAKPFAMGVRVEHPQEMINRVRYRGSWLDPHLPNASYSEACQIGGRGVYSFCMCPGGLMIPASTAPGEIVINGMSMARRDSPFANSGFVVSVGPEDWAPFDHLGPLAGLALQAEIEKKAWEWAGGTQKAPAQRISNFLSGRVSASLPRTSYFTGHTLSPVHDLFPPSLTEALRQGLRSVEKRLPGFTGADGVLVAPESRTSSPVRIPRNSETLEHPGVSRLFPCGEGAGYAGGIASAAMDGERVAQAVLQKLFPASA